MPYGGAGVDKKYTYTLGRHVYAPSVGTFYLKSFSCMKNCQVKGKQANFSLANRLANASKCTKQVPWAAENSWKVQVLKCSSAPDAQTGFVCLHE